MNMTDFATILAWKRKTSTDVQFHYIWTYHKAKNAAANEEFAWKFEYIPQTLHGETSHKIKLLNVTKNDEGLYITVIDRFSICNSSAKQLDVGECCEHVVYRNVNLKCRAQGIKPRE